MSTNVDNNQWSHHNWTVFVRFYRIYTCYISWTSIVILQQQQNVLRHRCIMLKALTCHQFLDFPGYDSNYDVSVISEFSYMGWHHGPPVRCVKLRVAIAPGMPGTLSPPPRLNDPDMYHGTCVPHVPWCMPGSLTGVFLWNRWHGKRSRHSRRVRNP